MFCYLVPKNFPNGILEVNFICISESDNAKRNARDDFPQMTKAFSQTPRSLLYAFLSFILIPISLDHKFQKQG